MTQAKSRPRLVPRTASPPEDGATGPARSSGPGPAPTLPTAFRPNQAVAGQEVLRGLSPWPPRMPVQALPPTHTRNPPQPTMKPRQRRLS